MPLQEGVKTPRAAMAIPGCGDDHFRVRRCQSPHAAFSRPRCRPFLGGCKGCVSTGSTGTDGILCKTMSYLLCVRSLTRDFDCVEVTFVLQNKINSVSFVFVRTYL